MNNALELRSEDHIHEDDREKERPDELIECAFKLFSPARDGGRVGRWQVHPSHFLSQRLEPIRKRVTRSRLDRCSQAHLPLAIEPVDARRSCGRDDLHQIVEAGEFSVLTRDVEPGNRRGIVPLSFAQANLHVVIVVNRLVVKPRDPLVSADHQTKRARYVLS